MYEGFNRGTFKTQGGKTGLTSFRCETLGWHSPTEKRSFDGVSFGSRCERCDRRILKDSQGNWFSVYDYEKEEKQD